MAVPRRTESRSTAATESRSPRRCAIDVDVERADLLAMRQRAARAITCADTEPESSSRCAATNAAIGPCSSAGQSGAHHPRRRLRAQLEHARAAIEQRRDDITDAHRRSCYALAVLRESPLLWLTPRSLVTSGACSCSPTFLRRPSPYPVGARTPARDPRALPEYSIGRRVGLFAVSAANRDDPPTGLILVVPPHLALTLERRVQALQLTL